MKDQQLVCKERQAISAMVQKDYSLAISLFEDIVGENPQWEHGQGYYNLACCFEDIGELDKAKENYQNALNIQPEYYMFVGGYASFLYRFGNPKDAFEWYLIYLEIESEISRTEERIGCNLDILERTRLAIFSLGEKLGLERRVVEDKINEYLSA